MKTFVGLALGTLLSLAAMSAASAASDVAPKPVGEPAIEVIVVTAKRTAPEAIDQIVVTAKRPGKGDQARTPPAMPIEIPRLEFVVAAPPVVRL